MFAMNEHLLFYLAVHSLWYFRLQPLDIAQLVLLHAANNGLFSKIFDCSSCSQLKSI